MEDYECGEYDPINPEEKEQKKFNPMELLNSPMVNQLLGGAKEIFKKPEPNPDTCEITIKAPSEVVLRLFKAG